MEDIVPPQKQCTKCNHVFPATKEYFHLDRGKLTARCKICAKAYREQHKEERNRYSREYNKSYQSRRKKEIKQYRDAHKEERLIYNEWYRKQNRDAIVAYQIQYNLKNRERKNTYSQQYHHTHKDKRAAYIRKYRQEHKEERLKYNKQYNQTEHGKIVRQAIKNKRRGIKKNIGGSYTFTQLQDQLKRQHNHCYYCQAKLKKGKGAWHADHVIPLTRENTSNTIDNIVIACPTCNLSKHNKLPHEWPKGGRLL